MVPELNLRDMHTRHRGLTISIAGTFTFGDVLQLGALHRNYTGLGIHAFTHFREASSTQTSGFSASRRAATDPEQPDPQIRNFSYRGIARRIRGAMA